jgi:magnesium chelatase family protein
VIDKLHYYGRAKPGWRDTSYQRCFAIAIQARKEGFKGLIVPTANAREAGMVNNLNVYGVAHIKEVIQFFESDEQSLQPVRINTREEFFHSQYDFEIDFADVKGQENIKRALEIACGRWTQCHINRATRCRKNNAGKTVATILPATIVAGSIGNNKDSFCCG